MGSSDTRTDGLLEENFFFQLRKRAGLGRLVGIAVSQSIDALLFWRFEVTGVSLFLAALGRWDG